MLKEIGLIGLGVMGKNIALNLSDNGVIIKAFNNSEKKLNDIKKEFKNDFSWSFSRDNAFNTRKRKYYYSYYGSWGGWNKDADEFLKTLLHELYHAKDRKKYGSKFQKEYEKEIAMFQALNPDKADEWYENNSFEIAAEKFAVEITKIVERILGKICLTINLLDLYPRTSPASTNSFSFNDINCPLTILATSTHMVKPIAIKT